MAVTLSVMDRGIIEQGRTAAEALDAVGHLVRRADTLGYRRFWFAEHHDSDLGASAVPALLIAHFATQTEQIRLGSGGVLAPNHSPLSLTEQFALLATLHPGRVDMGIGGGPGTPDQEVARELRRGAGPATDEDYHRDVEAMIGYLSGDTRIKPIYGWQPTPGSPAPWLLSSSSRGAELAARLGLPLALAHHLRPANTAEAVARYREHFTPSRWSAEPYVIISVSCIVAETEQQAAWLRGPLDHTVSFMLNGEKPALFAPARAATMTMAPELRARVDAMNALQALGTVDTVAERFRQLTEEFGADELMLVSSVYDPEDRARSLELAAKAAALA